MKKLCFSLIFTLAIFSISCVNAATSLQPTTGYVSQQQSGTKPALKALLALPTEISIINYSNYEIHAVIPGVLDQRIDAHATGNIKHGSYAGRTRVAIEDAYGKVLFDMNFCPHAIMTIDEGPAVFTMQTINNDC